MAKNKTTRTGVKPNQSRNTEIKPVQKRSKVDIIKKRIGLIDSEMGCRLAKKVLRQNGNNVTRAKLMVSRLENKPKEYTFMEISTNIVNLTKKIDQQKTESAGTRAKRINDNKIERHDSIPTSIIFLTSDSTKQQQETTANGMI